jgi:hypothetical protein
MALAAPRSREWNASKPCPDFDEFFRMPAKKNMDDWRKAVHDREREHALARTMTFLHRTAACA